MLLPLRGFSPLAILLLIWQFAGDPGSPYLPTPKAWMVSLADMAASGKLLPATAATIAVLLLGLAIACVLGFVLGLLIGTMPALRQWTAWLLEYFRATPPPVLIPVVVLILGYTLNMKLVIIGFAGIWPVLLNTISGV
jgi:ABC-type nitrate/sulfonate/bicarbonate transport system permease component